MSSAASNSGHDISPSWSGSIPFGGLRGDGEQLREGAEDAVLAVVLVVELAQDLRELLGVDVGGEVVLELLEGELRDPRGGADAVQAGASHRRAPGRVVSQVVTAAAPMPMARWRAASSSIHALPGPVSSSMASPSSSRRTAWQWSM